MNPANKGGRIGRHLVGGAIAAALSALLGIGLFYFHIGGGVTRTSYDLPFAFRGDLNASDVVLVYLDEASHKELNQPITRPWDRSLHARLIERLSADGAKAIVFDILFTEASTNAGADAQFANAIQRSRRVILGGNFNKSETVPGKVATWEELPYEPFRLVAAAWGNVNFLPDPDYGVRCSFPNLDNFSGMTQVAWLPWVVARFAGSRLTDADSRSERWLNYCGPPGALPGLSYSRALKPNGVPPGFFKNKIVFVGGRLSADFSGKGKDEFRTPYSYWSAGFAPGVDVHATATLNLLHHDWLTRMPGSVEQPLVWLIAGLSGFGLMRFRPLPATVVAVGSMTAIALIAFLLAWYGLIWFAWLIPELQIGVALLCSVIFNSVQLHVDKRVLEESLAVHLSPKLVKRLIHDPALRKLGGSQQEVSILFSDIANFSRISESMNSDDLVRMMNLYFETTLECIHETDGTVVKLIGDAIFAIWNAPVAQRDHRERACRAALLLREKIVEFNAASLTLPLRTRVGLHAGDATVGNIGSGRRFDYTALGDSINLASRLESLNKHIGTSVLASREVQRGLESGLTWRAVGHFQLKGLGRVVEVHEMVGGPDVAEPSAAWREQFAQALQDFRQRRFDSAAEKFQRTIDLRRLGEPEIATGTALTTMDGPSRFYLEQIEHFLKHPPSREWIGEVELSEK